MQNKSWKHHSGHYERLLNYLLALDSFGPRYPKDIGVSQLRLQRLHGTLTGVNRESLQCAMGGSVKDNCNCNDMASVETAFHVLERLDHVLACQKHRAMREPAKISAQPRM